MENYKKTSIETEITNALLRFSYGKLNVKQAQSIAKKATKNYDLSNIDLQHKGINWYVKQLLAKL